MKLLAQRRPTTTGAEELYRPPTGHRAEDLRIIISETAGGAAAYGVFIDDEIDSLDEACALAFAVAVPANSRVVVGDGENLVCPEGGRVGVKSSVGSALTFTLYGMEVRNDG